MQALDAHIVGSAPRPELPLDLRGTAFQIRVWRFLLQVPEGSVVSYAELAAGIGAPQAVRAAASACAANRIAVLVPCHRVLRGNGALGGYRWGLERKRVLIEPNGGGTPHEHAVPHIAARPGPSPPSRPSRRSSRVRSRTVWIGKDSRLPHR